MDHPSRIWSYVYLPRRSRTLSICLGLALAIILGPSSAYAGLGGDLNSVMNDQIHFQGSLQTTHTASFTVHEIHPQTGTVIREYVSSSGTVFAVSWRGAWLLDMQQLLGSYFEQYANAAKAQMASRPGRRPLQITQPDFVFQQGGHMRSFMGRAYLPQMLPAGMHAEEIQ